MRRRSERIPWTTAGRVSERLGSADEVVRETGWAFDRSGAFILDLGRFVATGDADVERFITAFGLDDDRNAERTLVEIGAGLGRMTSAFTRRFEAVIACDLDEGLLERCYETAGRFGRADHLQTLPVRDGRTLDLPDAGADMAFSYHTLQHCRADDALELAEEAIRVVRPGGRIALHFRGPTPFDGVVMPIGSMVRSAFVVPKVGPFLARARALRRITWVASRFHPDQVIGPLAHHLADVQVWTAPNCRLAAHGARIRESDQIARRSWWLVATVA